MTKKRSAAQRGIPGCDDVGEPVTVPVAADPDPDVCILKRSVVTLEVPVLDGMIGYAARRIDMTLTQAQADKVRGILAGLDDQGAKLESGVPVTRPVHAIQWMIERAS